MNRRLIAANAPKDASGAYLPPEAFRLDTFLFDKQLKFVEDPHPFKIAVCSRRAGKCRAKGTLVKTPTGSVAIENLNVGAKVYGYNSDGSVAVTTVTAVYDQGVKEVVDLVWNGRVLATSTEDHRWLAHNVYKHTEKVKALKQFNCRDKIARAYVPIPGGTKHVKEAYALGAFLGDGCSREPTLAISGADTAILDKMALELAADWTSAHEHNYTYYFKGVKKSRVPLYHDWLHNRYAHEKTCDLSEIRQWDRDSQLRLIAGLIDTDGSVSVQYDRLVIRLAMQAKDVIDTVQALLLDLFQVQALRTVDRRKKYKNGPVYQLSVGTNAEAKRILRELPTQCTRKQWKPEYENLVDRNYKGQYSGFTLKNRRQEQCYDITVDNDTHLFLDANGLIGHNTISCAAHLVDTALKNAEVLCLYVTLSRANAKRIIWRELQKINNKYKLKGTEDNVELSMTFPNGSVIYLSGAKDSSEIEKFRGMPFKLVYIDECQSFRPYIEELIDDVIGPALMDYDGTLCLIGTPGAIPAGYFAEVAGAVQDKKTKSDSWTHYAWTFFDNPHIPIKSKKTHQQMLDRELKRRGVTVDDPSIQREWFGKWVLDSESLWIKYYKDKNDYATLPELPKPHTWNYIMGIDLGFNDADAIAILAWSSTSPVTYLVDEMVVPKQGLTELVEEIQAFRQKYEISKMVIDEGGLGKKLAEEMRRRHRLPVQAADKARKQETAAFFNDALRTGRFKAKADSRFTQDSYLVEIDREKSTPDRVKVSDKYHSDIIDAVLYAFKDSPAFSYQEPEEGPKVGSPEWNRKEQEAMFEAAQKHFEDQASHDAWMKAYE